MAAGSTKSPAKSGVVGWPMLPLVLVLSVFFFSTPCVPSSRPLEPRAWNSVGRFWHNEPLSHTASRSLTVDYL